jgi:hypothetical protein
MSKKTKRHVKKVASEKKVPRISVMEQQKKRRSKLYAMISVVVGIVVIAAIVIGAIISGNSGKPDSELVDGHFAQKEGFFEMSIPKDWSMKTSLVETAPYGLENCQYPYLFLPPTAPKPTENAEGSETTIPEISKTNIICAVFTPGAKKEDIEKFLTGQNMIAEQDIVQYFGSKGKLEGLKLEKANAWVFGEKPLKVLTSGSAAAYIEGESFTAYMHGKFEDEASRKQILDAFKSIVTKNVEPANLKEYTDKFGYATIPTPEGWKCDLSSDALQVHQIFKDYGALFYPAGSKNKLEMSPEDLKNRMQENDGKKIEGEITTGITFTMPFRDYLAAYIIDPKTNPAAFNKALADFFVGFKMNSIENPYEWIKKTAVEKGTQMEKCQGKYFINDPIQIMNVKPEKSIFGVIESKDGMVVLMGGWTNDGVKDIIIDTINKITAAPKGK